MKHLKTFQQLNEAKIQDPKTVMSEKAWEEASKMRAVVLKDQTETVENPVYFVVREEGDTLVLVIDEKMDLWLDADSNDRVEYYEDVVHKSEVMDHKIK